jgi:hypothetical protein
MAGSEVSRAGRIGLLVVANLAVIGVLFALLEGCASLVVIGHDIVTTPGVPERTHNHVEHDTLLGWVNRPDVHLPDAYGAGRTVSTNRQRFRGMRDYAEHVPAGRLRIICSGDSFTFGYGVGDGDAWCARLTDLDARLETINMGLGGYGVDQAYLWYMRDGMRFDHDMQIFAFVTDDFHRMRADRFMGYGRPLLDMRGDSIVVTNVPVPQTSWLARRQARHGESIARLRIVRVLRRATGMAGDARAAANAARNAREDERVRRVVARIFAELRRANDVRGSRLVLVYLPGTWDYWRDTATDRWREFIRAEASRQDLLLLDLVEELRRVAPTQVDGLYDPNAHFSIAGNEWAARVLYERLRPVIDSLAARQ